LRAADFCLHVGAKADERVVRVGVIPAVIALFNDILAVRHTGYSSLSFVHAANQMRQLFTHIAIEAQMPAVNRSTLDLSSVQAFMRDNLHRALDLEALARVAGLSKFHFSHRYSLATGYSPMRHFTHMKMEAACRLLDTTDHSVQRVASALSFDDPLYFSRVFRKVIGCSPQQYRASNLR
jgi:AraC-like DNA-binding protein